MNMLQQMQGLVGVLVVVVIVVLYARRALGRTRGKSPTANGNVLEVIDEVFSPARHTAAMELRTQQQQGPTAPAPEDWLPASYDGLYIHVKGRDATSPTDSPHSTGDPRAPSEGPRTA